MNETLVRVATLSLVVAGVCVVIIVIDLLKRPQPMGIMNVVWPVTALYAGPLALLAYFRIGRADLERGGEVEQKPFGGEREASNVKTGATEMAQPGTTSSAMAGMKMSAGTDTPTKIPMGGETKTGSGLAMPMTGSGTSASAMAGMKMDAPVKAERPFWQKVLVGTTHCGAGCTIADIIGHWLIFFLPFVLFGRVLFAAWTLDYVLALAIGVLFQFAAIQPMLHLPVGQGLVRAFKIDFLSLTAWQIGMYGWMALVIFVIFKRESPPTDVFFWFMMQLAMIAGFVTAYPVNWWLIKRGTKTAM